MITIFKKIIVFSTAVLSCALAFGASEARFPQPEGYVNDYAHVLSSTNKSQIEALLKEVEAKAGVQIAVVTVKTTAPLTIEQYAVELFQKWGIGQKGEDKGLLILLATGDKKVRIEVGYGLEGVVTDLKSKVMIDTLMVPHFKDGDYDLGVSSGVVMLAKMIKAEYKVEYDLSGVPSAKPEPRAAKDEVLSGLLTLLFFILIFGFRFGTLFFFASSRSGGNYWSSGSGGSFGGGFGGFGGGMSGGGGSSGSW